MTERKMDHEVITGWEKRIKVDFGSIGPNHVRWSNWTFKERDIVARKIHESASISRDHGPRSRRMEDWAKENAPIMIDFARDDKPMPDWAHAGYRESGVPEYVKVVWKRDNPADMASPADWAYDPPGPWEDKGEEPPWSSRPMDKKPTKIIGLETEGKLDSKFGGVVSYKTMPNGDHVATDGTVISTAASRAKEDIPQWKKFEIGRLEIVDNAVIPGPNALPEDEEEYGGNRQFTNIHKTRGNAQVASKADPRLVETVRDYWQSNLNKPNKGENWRRVLIAFGVEPDDGAGPFTVAEALEGEKIWSGWRPVREELERLAGGEREPIAAERDPIEDANRYRKAAGLPPVEKSQGEKLRDALVETNDRPDVVVKEFNPDTGTLDEIKGKPEYRIPGTMTYGPDVPKPGSTGWYVREIKWLPQWYWDLPEITDEEAKEQGATSRASVAPLNYIYHKKGTGILGRLKRSPERTDLPIWTKDEAEAYYRSKGIKMRSRQWLDGHLMQQPGYTDTGDGNGKFVARAADEEYEKTHQTVAAPTDIAAAIAAGDWALVAKLAKEKAG